jgi:uncharacterized repeat protein (TIGR03803 family)
MIALPFGSGRYALGIAVVLTFAACSDLREPLGVSGETPLSVTRPHQGPAYELLYSFKGGADGEYPRGGLARVGGLLYGTTSGNGCGSSCAPGAAGTVFDMTTSGVENVIYSFKGAPDAQDPSDSLLGLNGMLYGTTQVGGTYGYGTVFKVTTSGSEQVLYSFRGGSDGAAPFASLIALDGVLYGTTFNGGGSGCSIGCGTVFRMSTSGKERVLYSFKGYPHDGARPLGALVALSGKLYGTTWIGGGGGCDAGCGTVFEVSTSGHERMLHSFRGPPDGENPEGGLVPVNGKLYGTTANGGTSMACQTLGCGTVFDISASTEERTLHSFRGGRGGEQPNGGLLFLNGLLYGTAEGGSKCAPSGRCGIVFSVSRLGVERVLHRFEGSPDGAYPGWPLLAARGRLFGTTVAGGANGYGTTFVLTP